jgi:hypothetical protein
VGDVHQSVKFYEKVLGARHLYKEDKDFGYNPAFLSIGQGVKVALLPLQQGQTKILNHNGAHFAINIASLDTFRVIQTSLPEVLDSYKRCHDGTVDTNIDFFDYGR